MPREVAEYSAELYDFSYEDVCSGINNKLNLSSCHSWDGRREDENGISAKVYMPNYEETGDSLNIALDSDGPPAEFELDGELVVEDCSQYEMKIENYEEAAPWRNFLSSNLYPSFGRSDLRIRYTREYLLNLQRSSQSTAFPDCLVKYLNSDQVPLRRKKREVQQECRNLDHILFYSTLPYSRVKHPLGNSMKRKALV